MNRSHNQPNDDAEGYDLDHVLDDAFTSRRVPVLSPSMMDVRRRARRRTNRTRATGLAAVACVSVGGVAVLANNHKPGSRPAVGATAGNGDDACASAATWELVPMPTLLAPETTWKVVPTTTALSAGFVAAATSTTASDSVTTTTCAPQPPSGFRCAGDPTVTQDGWTYYDYCEAVDNATLPTATYFESTLPPLCAPIVEGEQVYSVVFGDYLFGIAKLFGQAAETVAVYNEWPEGVEHPLNPGDLVKIPPGSCTSIAVSDPIFTTTAAVDGGATGEQVDRSIFTTTTNLLATTTSVGP